MAFCRNCGTKMEENAKFCHVCGTAQATTETENNLPPITAFPSPFPSHSLSVGILVWSILNLLFCCMPLGIVSLIMTVAAKDAPTAEEEAKKLKAAKICNLIATIGAVVIYVIYFAAMVVLALFGTGEIL